MNIKIIFLCVTFFLSLSLNELLGQLPFWVKEEFERLEGTWITDNSEFVSDTETDDHYAVEWSMGVGNQSMTGILYGLRDNRMTHEYWQFFQFWDPARQAVRVIQVAVFGAVGDGYMMPSDSSTFLVEQIFVNPDQSQYQQDHITRIFETHDVIESYSYNEHGEKILSRNYNWYKREPLSELKTDFQLYLDKIALAESYFQQNKAGAARIALDGCPHKYRDLEWHVLDKMISAYQQSTLIEGMGSITDIQTNEGHELIFACGSDGRVVSLSKTGMSYLDTYHQHSASASTIDLSPSGQLIASGGRDHQVIVSRIATGDILIQNDTSFSQGIYDVVFSPDETMLAVVSWERLSSDPWITGYAEILDIPSGKRVMKIETEPHPAAQLVWSADSRTVTIACWGQMTNRYDLASGELIWSYDKNDNDEYTAFHSLALDPSENLIAAGSTDKRIHILDFETGALLHKIESWEGHRNTVNQIMFSPDGNQIASAGEDGLIYIWNSKDFSKSMLLTGHQTGITGLSWDKKSETLYSTDKSGMLYRWDLMHPNINHYRVCINGPWQLPVTEDYFLAPCSDSSLTVRRITDGHIIHQISSSPGLCGDISSDGRYLATASFDGRISFYDMQSESGFYQANHKERVDGIAILENTEQLISVGGNTLKVWPYYSDTAIVEMLFDSAPFRVVDKQEEDRVYVTHVNGDISVVSTNDWKVDSVIETGHAINTLVHHEDSSMLAATGDGTIFVRSAETGNLTHTLRGHTKSAYGLDFSHDGRYLVSGSYDHTLKLWNLDKEVCTLTLHGFDAPVYQVRFVNATKLLVSTSSGRISYINFCDI